MKVRGVVAGAGPGAAGERVGWARAGAYGIAGVTHLVSAGLLAGGSLLVVLGWETGVQPLIGLLLVGYGVRLRPRVEKLDPELPTLRRRDAPALYGLLDDIADAAGARHVDVVQVGPDFGVRASAYGVRRRRRLEIGLPCWLTLAPQQRVAAVAHELGHFVSGDARQGLLVGGALGVLTSGTGSAQRIGSVESLFTASSPLSRHADEMAEAARRFDVHSRASDAALWFPRLLWRGAVRQLVRLSLPGARRTEFLADAVAARVASSEAAVSALRSREFAGPVTSEVQRRAVALRTFGRPGEAKRVDERFWAEIEAFAGGLRRDAEEPDDRGAAAPSGGSYLPSDAERVARLTAAATHPATVTLDAATVDAVQGELRELKALLARKVLADCVYARRPQSRVTMAW